mgnify:CR=1 FL=1|tara:strand:- start:195009 stop:196544 length:1536 start_codon:yes stop_codon:yes gene_type:complete
MSTLHDKANPSETESGQTEEHSPVPRATDSPALAKRLLIGGLFWGLCLTLTAAGHRLYKATVSVDRHVSRTLYQTDGAPLVWVGHGTAEDAMSRIAEGQVSETDRQLHAQPVSTFLVAVVLGLTWLAALMAWSGRWIEDNGMQSLIGLFTGHFLWLGAIEFGLDAVGRRIGLAGALDVVNGRIMGTHGGGILIQMSAVFLIPMLIGLTLHESNRCAIFQWFRRRLPLTRSAAASGRVDNYAARTTIQYFMTVWFCYASVLWLADPMLGRVGEFTLLTVMLVIFAATPYMIWRTACQPGTAQALRYSVSGAIVTWTGIEIAASMRFFDEPWLSSSVLSGVILLGSTIGLTVLVMFALRQTTTPSMLLKSATGLVVLIALTGVSGCTTDGENVPSTADEIVSQLRSYDDRIEPPNKDAAHGLLRALGSGSPEMAAQAAVAFGKSGSVNADVRKQLEDLALSDDSRLKQFSALLALSRLGLLTSETRDVIKKHAADVSLASVVAYILNEGIGPN